MKEKTLLFIIISWLAFATSAHAGYAGLSPEAGNALIIFCLFCFAVYLIVGCSVMFVKWLKKNIKKWVNNWKD